jgi:hypothetical protein
MEAVRTSETLVDFYETTRRYIQECWRLQLIILLFLPYIVKRLLCTYKETFRKSQPGVISSTQILYKMCRENTYELSFFENSVGKCAGRFQLPTRNTSIIIHSEWEVLG